MGHNPDVAGPFKIFNGFWFCRAHYYFLIGAMNFVGFLAQVNSVCGFKGWLLLEILHLQNQFLEPQSIYEISKLNGGRLAKFNALSTLTNGGLRFVRIAAR